MLSHFRSAAFHGSPKKGRVEGLDAMPLERQVKGDPRQGGGRPVHADRRLGTGPRPHPADEVGAACFRAWHGLGSAAVPGCSG